MLLMMWSSAVVYFISLVSNPITHQVSMATNCALHISFVGDNMRAMDKFTSDILMGGKNTILCCTTRPRILFGLLYLHHLRFGPSNHLTITSIRLS